MIVNLIGITDLYRRFELTLPFNKISIDAFTTHVDNATKNCGNKGFVTIEALANELDASAWPQLD